MACQEALVVFNSVATFQAILKVKMKRLKMFYFKAIHGRVLSRYDRIAKNRLAGFSHLV